MLDKTLVSIISMILGGVGLIGAITRYSIPKSGKTIYGENLFLLKENIINNVVTWFFTIYAMIGLLFQILFGEILELENRVYNTEQYLLFFIFALILILSLVPVIKRIGKWFAKIFWIPQIAEKAKKNFILAKELFESASNLEEQNISRKLPELIDWFEELFEVQSKERDIKNRLYFFEKNFSKYN